METHPFNKSAPQKNLTVTGPVTRAMVRTRARELAVIAGRAPPHVTQVDYQQARRELTGESETDLQDAIPEAKRWDPVPGSAGRQTRESPSEEEDAEGRSETAQLVDEGAEEAERDRMFQAARAAAKTDGGAP